MNFINTKDKPKPQNPIPNFGKFIGIGAEVNNQTKVVSVDDLPIQRDENGRPKPTEIKVVKQY